MTMSMTESNSSLTPAVTTKPDTGAVLESSFSKKRGGGPKTAAGKRRSALNSVKGGLYSSATIVRGENESEYLNFARSIVADLNVESALEMACAERLVSALWRARRARRFEQGHLDIAAREVEHLRNTFEGVAQAFATLEAEEKALSSVVYPSPMRTEVLEDAAAGVLRMARALVKDNWQHLEDMVFATISQRSRSSKQAVEAFCIAVHEAMLPVFKSSLEPAATVRRIRDFVGEIKEGVRIERDKAERAYELARACAFLLPADQAGTLADAENRLERQVSRAMADLEATRRLRAGAG